MTNSLPSRIYHYTSQDGLLGILSSRNLWASDIRFTSDESEFRIAWRTASEILRQRRSLDDLDTVRQSFLDELIALADAPERRTAFVASFSAAREGDLLSQWRGYCPPDGGYSLGFDSAALDKTARRQGFQLVKCVYRPDEHRALLEKIIDASLDELVRASQQKVQFAPDDFRARFSGVDYLRNKLRRTIERLAPSLKDVAFEEEQEWRLVRADQDAPRGSVGVRRGRWSPIPYFRVDLVGEDSTLPLRTIRVGPNPYVQDAYLALNEVVRSSAVSPQPEILKSAIPFRHW